MTSMTQFHSPITQQIFITIYAAFYGSKSFPGITNCPKILVYTLIFPLNIRKVVNILKFELFKKKKKQKKNN